MLILKKKSHYYILYTALFALQRKQPPYAALCGALVYTFCACAYTGLYPSGFILPQILFPLLLCGADELFDHNRPVVYVLVLVCSAVTNFYNTYMMIVMLLGYCVLKWFFGTEHRRAVVCSLVPWAAWRFCISGRWGGMG